MLTCLDSPAVSNVLTKTVFGLNELRWYARLPLKWLIFGLTVLAVCFPYPRLAYRHLSHWRDPNALIEPEAPALQPWVAELRASLPADSPPKETLQHVQQFVHRKLPYEWDWNTWGLSDYLPTVEEAVSLGKEDCDGRAVVAASLLRNLGFESRIVTDFAHVWVQTNHGETMGPGRRKAIVATETGINVNWRGLVEIPRALAYGVAVFPWRREMIVLLVGWWLLLGRSGLRVSAAALGGLLLGFFLLHRGGGDYRHPVVWMQISGGALMGFSAAVLLFSGRGGERNRQLVTNPHGL